MSQAVLEALQSRFGAAITKTHSHCGDDTATVDRTAIVDVARFLKDDPAMAFDMPIDVTAVDYLEFKDYDGPRYCVVYHFYSTAKRHRVRLRIELPADDPKMPSVWPVFRGVDWFERETFDMYGIVFDGHYDLRRMLMYEEFQGHPLRKDYPLRGYQPLIPIARLDKDNEDPKLVHQDLNPEVPSHVALELATERARSEAGGHA